MPENAVTRRTPVADDDALSTGARASAVPRGRAILIALPLLVGICFISVYADMVAKEVQFGVLQLAPPAVVALFFIALMNRLLARLFRRAFLSGPEIVVIYAMLLVGVLVSTRGVIEKLIPPLAYLPYFAKENNRLNELITQYLPAWALPFTPSATLTLPDTLRSYHEGMRPGETIPWHIWIGPLAVWFALIACVILVFACLATLLRRRWMDEERLSFPLTTLPLAVMRNEVEGQPFLSNPGMWMGFAVSAAVFGLNGFHANIPGLPHIVVDFNVSPLLTQRPWSEMDGIRLWGSLAAIGFAYFLPNDLLFSLWFFFLLTRAQDAVSVLLGGMPVSIGTHNARIWTGYQAAGAYVVLIIAQVRIGWPYFTQVWQSAFGQEKTLDDRGELMSYRAAFIGLFAGFGGIVLWLSLAGMNPLLATAQMGIYLFVIAVIMTRAVSEAGLLMTETSFLPTHLIRMVAPLHSLGPTNLSLLALTDIVFTRDLRGVLLSPFMDTQKIAGQMGMRQRALLLPLALSVVVAFVVAAYFFLRFHYVFGGVNLYGYPNGNARNLFGIARASIQGDARPLDATAYGGFAVGLTATTAMVWLRARTAWFPLNPLGYAVAPTWSLFVFWFPFFVAWLLKASLARWGSIHLYRRLAPFMLGLILGEFTMAVFWAIMNTPGIGWNAPAFPWP